MFARFSRFRVAVMLVSAALLAGCQSSVKDIVTDAGFIYADPPARFNNVGSLLIVQQRMSGGGLVFTEICANHYFDRDLQANLIQKSPGEERTAIEKISAQGSIDIMSTALGALADSGDASVRAGAEQLVSSEIKLRNVTYLVANIPYVAQVARELGKSSACGGDGTNDKFMASLRDRGLKTYHVHMVLSADYETAHKFKLGVDAQTSAALSAAINAKLKAAGVIDNVESGKGTGLNIGYRLWDPDCPGVRIDRIPRNANDLACREARGI